MYGRFTNKSCFYRQRSYDYRYSRHGRANEAQGTDGCDRLGDRGSRGSNTPRASRSRGGTRDRFEPSIQALNDVIFLGKRHRELNPNSYYHRYLPPELRGVSRVRQFGGTSNVWTGKWKYLQPSDFEKRDWVDNSGWPIDFTELLEHYRSAAKDYGFGDLEADCGTSSQNCRTRFKNEQLLLGADTYTHGSTLR